MRRSVYFFGLSTIIVSVILIFSQFVNLAITNSMGQITGSLGGYPGLKSGILGTMTDMFEYNRIWSIYSIFYFLATLIGGIQFIRFQESGRRILEIACWVGMLNACVDTTASYMFWKEMETAMSAIVGGMGAALSQMNPIGLGAIIVGFFIWVIPSIGIIIYVRKPSLRAQMVSKENRQSGTQFRAG
jgi:hypothetical protein